MKPRHIILIGTMAFLAAWLLPVTKGGVTLPNGLPGWQAFLAAAGAIWDKDLRADSLTNALLATASAATNLVMLGLIPVALGAARRWVRFGAIAAAACFLINAKWVAASDRGDLRLGYFMWWLSFLIFAYGLRRRAMDEAP